MAKCRPTVKYLGTIRATAGCRSSSSQHHDHSRNNGEGEGDGEYYILQFLVVSGSYRFHLSLSTVWKIKRPRRNCNTVSFWRVKWDLVRLISKLQSWKQYHIPNQLPPKIITTWWAKIICAIYCYSNSYSHDGDFYQCIPSDAEWHSIEVGVASVCGSPCQDIGAKAPSYTCPAIDSATREADSLIYRTTTWTGKKDPFQTCYKDRSGGSHDQYCYSNSYERRDFFYQCIPNNVDKVLYAIDTMTLRLPLGKNNIKCEKPCQDSYMKQRYLRMCAPINSTDFLLVQC